MQPQGPRDIADKLRLLSEQMAQLSGEMRYFGGFSAWAMYAEPMMGASEAMAELAALVESDKRTLC